MRHEDNGRLTLYSYWRSSAAYRVRIALHLKGLEFETVPVHLLRNGGEQLSAAYLALNPQGRVPVLAHGGRVLTQSMAICEYLDDIFPDCPLLPADPFSRAQARSLALQVACEIHPLNNLRVLMRLREQFGAGDEAEKAWFTHWVTLTFDALETALAESPETGRFCHGDQPTLADLCLYAQVWNNRRFAIPLDGWPVIARIFAELDRLPAFRDAAPPAQPDAA